MIADLKKEFHNRFQQEAEAVYFCPGRVNLIGEHIDYNGGKVMPCAISLGTYVAVKRNGHDRLRFESMNFPGNETFELKNGYQKTGSEWFNYPLGVFDELIRSGHKLVGMDMLFTGNLPIGAGLSSSASIEVLTAYMLNDLLGLGITKQALALMSQKVENEFIGVNCGIMDQFAVAMGEKEKAILLDCDTLDYQYLPFQTKGYTLAIINSNKKRTLAESKYNERFDECMKALSLLKKEVIAENLCQLSPEQFEANRHLIGDPVLEKRALHVITENDRVKRATEALAENRLEDLGALMYLSHRSLKELYEVSGKELDTIVDFCRNYEGCIGARMTGAGFGGCAIALVRNEKINGLEEKLNEMYTRETGYVADVFASDIGDGVRVII